MFQKLASLFVTFGFLVLSVAPVSAVQAANPPDLGMSYPEKVGLGKTDIRYMVGKIIRVALSLLGAISVVVVVMGGFTWMTAGGNDEKVGEAKKWIYSGVIGLAIILSAYAIVSYVFTGVLNATQTGETQGPLMNY